MPISLRPRVSLASPGREAAEDLPQDFSLPRNCAPVSELHKTLVGWSAGGTNDTATQDCDSRAALAPPRPVISLPLPARVNNSPSCQMQVTFVPAMKELGRRRLIFGGQEEVWGIN